MILFSYGCLPCFLGLQKRVDVTVIAATNRPDNIDPALLRPGKAKHDTISIYSLDLYIFEKPLY